MASVDELKIPGRMTPTGRTTSVTAAFAGALLPRSEPSREDKLRALTCLGLDVADVACAYCGDVATEWDHLRPTVKDQSPTGWRTECANLIPSCGKCNQSKGNKDWEEWMRGNARQSPTTRRIPDLERRIEALKRFEREFPALRIDLDSIRHGDQWRQYWSVRDEIIRRLKDADRLAAELNRTVAEQIGIKNAALASTLVVPVGSAEGDDVD